MGAPQFAILLDGGFVTKKLYERNGRAATAEDIEQECERLKALPCLAGYELLRIYHYDAPLRRRRCSSRFPAVGRGSPRPWSHGGRRASTSDLEAHADIVL